MRRANAILIALLLFAVPAQAAPSPQVDLVSTESVLRWINAYRTKPDPMGVPAAVHALSKFGALRDPEQAGAYVGFIAGIIGSHPDKAGALISKMLPLPPGDQWALVRAIAYSGHPDWRNLLRRYSGQLSARKVLIDKYLGGEMPKLYDFAPEPTVSTWASMRNKVTGKELPKRFILEPSPELLDTYWGHYFATAQYRPITRIIDMLPLAKDSDNLEKLTVGSMAKFTLASNATRDPELLAMIKEAREQRPKEVASALTEVIDAAETVETARLRREAQAAIEELRRKGPGYRRTVSLWGQVGTGALAVGCIAAAATGHVELGLPCVIGGGVSSAALTTWEKQQP
jgi:hypothetical protein